jgi:hypothetical protein
VRNRGSNGEESEKERREERRSGGSERDKIPE